MREQKIYEYNESVERFDEFETCTIEINEMHSLNIASRISSDKVGSPSTTWLPSKKARLGVTTFSENGGCLSLFVGEK